MCCTILMFLDPMKYNGELWKITSEGKTFNIVSIIHHIGTKRASQLSNEC